MARILYGADNTTRGMRRQLNTCDPASLQTLCVPIQRNQGLLLFGAFIDLDGNRAVIASQVEGLLAASVDTALLPDLPEDRSGEIAIYTSGRFVWPSIRRANSAFVFDQVSIDVLKQGNHVRAGLPNQSLDWWALTFMSDNEDPEVQARINRYIDQYFEVREINSAILIEKLLR